MRKNLEEKLVNVLAYVYKDVKWRKIRTKNAYDVFNHRVRAAAHRSTIYEFISKLCNYFGLQSLPTEVMQDLDYLRKYENEVLNALVSEHIPLSLKAILKAKKMKGEKTK